MGKAKDKKEKKYNFRKIIKCKKCGHKAEDPGPCLECGNHIFVTELECQEI